MLNRPTENLEASATLAWESIDAWGLQAGPGVVAATLKRSVLKTEPIEFTLSGGQARLLPRVTLGDRPTLTVLRGTRMQNVALTEQVTAEWLRFVTPLLADSARVRGKFSAAVQSATVPLDDPTTSDVSGVLRIHTATAEPGLMVEQLVGVVDQVRTVLGKNPRGTRGMRVGVPEQEIRFRVLDQRVHHDRFRLEIDGVTLSTSGSVGFDQTLDLVAELTLPDKWLGSSDFTRSLAGQPLRMPIRGTFSQPQIDRSFLRDLTAGAAGRAVNNLLDKQLDRGLNNLLDRIK